MANWRQIHLLAVILETLHLEIRNGGIMHATPAAWWRSKCRDGLV
jgi:hypothetical protein